MQAAREKDFDLVFMVRVSVHRVALVAIRSLLGTSQKSWFAYVSMQDMEMPVMNGVDACLAINKIKQKMLPVIVFVTAHAMETFRKQAFDAGGYGFVSKPFNLEKIQSLIESIPWDKLRESEYPQWALRKSSSLHRDFLLSPETDFHSI